LTGLRFVQVDAFASAPFSGNPAAVMLLDAWLDDAILQAIAQENNLAETAFLVPTAGDADHELRWFTPAMEVALCGHATLASGHVVLGDDPARLSVRFRTRASGILTVSRAGDGYALDLPAWSPVAAAMPETVAALGGNPIETLAHDRGYAIIVYAREAEVRALAPDFRALAGQGTIAFIVTAPGETDDIVSRVFVPGAGVDEDPVTGSAYSLLAPYWTARLGRARFSAFQASPRGGRLDCTLAGDRVVLGGHCITVIEGRFRI
jgi:predicted PhzF superfamily epimerase YddE/YHI9